MRVNEPSTCGWMLAERRDFTVATYSSIRGTAVSLTVCVLTGRGCGAACTAFVLPHPELAKEMRPNNPMNRPTFGFFISSILVSLVVVSRCLRLGRDSICVLTGMKQGGFGCKGLHIGFGVAARGS